ncbi:hypothetical protein P280DRAFT_157185 [Massarina eburnea CBS 473.64]|uniref:Secreted protein n=1 Tax=Massarina eburnea CBS 473.64 TaxID=1395130 RepID=A0A6A6RLW3_9PLEO|nr:hypothetical protein P280DRAFT_157185 [Massarina eburnea CBS 473.64]
MPLSKVTWPFHLLILLTSPWYNGSFTNLSPCSMANRHCPSSRAFRCPSPRSPLLHAPAHSALSHLVQPYQRKRLLHDHPYPSIRVENNDRALVPLDGIYTNHNGAYNHPLPAHIVHHVEHRYGRLVRFARDWSAWLTSNWH